MRHQTNTPHITRRINTCRLHKMPKREQTLKLFFRPEGETQRLQKSHKSARLIETLKTQQIVRFRRHNILVELIEVSKTSQIEGWEVGPNCIFEIKPQLLKLYHPWKWRSVTKMRRSTTPLKTKSKNETVNPRKQRSGRKLHKESWSINLVADTEDLIHYEENHMVWRCHMSRGRKKKWVHPNLRDTSGIQAN